MSAFYAAYQVVQKINLVLVSTSCIFIALITVLTIWEVITRYFFRQPATWTYPITSYLLLYSIVFAAGYALQRGGHVRVEVVVEVLPVRFRRWLERLAHVLGMVFVFVLLSQTWRDTWRVLREGDRDVSTLSIPLWIPSLGMTLGVAMLAITYVFVVVDAFIRPPDEATVQEVEKAQVRANVDVD